MWEKGPWIASKNKRHRVCDFFMNFGVSQKSHGYTSRVLSKVVCHNLKTLIKGVQRSPQQITEYDEEHKKKTFEQIAQRNACEVCSLMEQNSLTSTWHCRSWMRKLLNSFCGVCPSREEQSWKISWRHQRDLSVRSQSGFQVGSQPGSFQMQGVGLKKTAKISSFSPTKGTNDYGLKRLWRKQPAWASQCKNGYGWSPAKEQTRFVGSIFSKRQFPFGRRSCGLYLAFYSPGGGISDPTSS